MNDNMNFYKFMHRQIFVVIILFVSTSPGYIVMGYLYSEGIVETAWFIYLLAVSLYGYKLYKDFDSSMSIEQKDTWLKNVLYFMFVYFSLWSIIFVVYVLRDNIQMHYIALATQLGSAVVAATILASQKKLVIATVSTLMLPITIYLLIIGNVYSYILAFFTVVLSGVLLYAAKNTHEYLLKSRFQAYHDYLTGLGNRRYFLNILEDSVKFHKEKYTYLLLIDLDYFKTINDTLGHDIGDELLIEVSHRMSQLSHEANNKVARLGGDEFCILSETFEDKKTCLKNADIFARDLLKSIKNNYILDGNNLYISASIGVSIMQGNIVEASEFLKEADMAMYEAKHNGRDGIIIFNDELCAIVQKKLEIERLLHSAIKNNEISLVYQPQVDKEKKVIGCEVLVRWKSEKFGPIGPDVFIPIAENTGYIIELGYYILEESFRTIQEWSIKNLNLKQISINLSVRQLLHQDFMKRIFALFNRYNIDKYPIDIIFEITETSAAEDLNRLIVIINKLKEYNIFFSMDDFGTGYSSLSYLRDIPINELKIDQSFVFQLDDVKQASLVKSIIEISKNLNLTIVAEGVEKEYQREFLVDLDCDLYQGYLFSKPLKKLEFEEFCTR